MNNTTQYKSIRATRFKLKPLLIAIPLSVLAACANNQSPTVSENTPAPTTELSQTLETGSSHTLSDNNAANHDSLAGHQIETGPDLTSTTINSETAPEPLNNSSDRLIEHTQQGNDPMTVLVIENPEILSKLASENLKSVVPMPENTVTESLNRPGKRVFHFGFNQSNLSEEDLELVEQHAEYLKSNPALQVTIHGHTDAQGDSNYNLKLSQQRAAMMVSELIKQGVSKNRIKTIGWGGGYPLVNSQHFAENRRIEIEYSTVHYAANQ
ncbi:OmpA family protein [Alkalimarinus alittae]|uniref:OmpA family protein n=1 Tax=Alkalimarinus alittae TaxID=2961619 RepID=A0ABY6N394_9ALTE|nr:OmpA family protein [Alkalimarinus alittae]UZE96583.1 OmpA family protein [Alkalimarinus alittae]